jgi:hypothetical protein
MSMSLKLTRKNPTGLSLRTQAHRLFDEKFYVFDCIEKSLFSFRAGSC